MFKASPKRLSNLMSFIAGGMLVLAFAPIHQFYFAVLAPAILYIFLKEKTPKQAAFTGWCFGLGQFGFGVSWVFISIHVYGFTPIPIAIIFTGLFVATLALFPMLQCWWLNYFFPNESKGRLLLGFPLSWALVEWLRSWLFTGFPWLLIAYSQVDSPLKGYIPLLGEFGLAFIIIFCSSLIVLFLSKNGKIFQRVVGATIFIIVLLGGFALSTVHWTHPIGKKKKVVLVQGNIPQSIKWDPNRVFNILSIYANLTKQNLDANLIVWPEAAVPLPKKYAKSFLQQMNSLALQHNISLFTGIPVQDKNSFSYYNAIISLGKGSGHYYKQRLVPFGEYVPFENVLRGLMGFFSLPMSNMIPGPALQPDLKAKKTTIAPFICYEIAYGQNLFEQASKANVLLTISDDAWFGDSLAPGQHLEIGQFRAIQSGRDLLFASNDGITAIINDKGNVIKEIPQFTRGVLTGYFQDRTGKTPWLFYGNKPIIIFMLILFIGIVIRRVYRPKKL